MVDVPLSSPTTDAALDQANSRAQNGTDEQSSQESTGGNLGQAPHPMDQGTFHNAQNMPPKPPTFTYVHDDSDTAMAELEEFFS